MKQEKTLFAIAIIIVALMIAATIVCAIKYMHEEPWWNRGPVPVATEAPEAESAALQEVATENLPPG